MNKGLLKIAELLVAIAAIAGGALYLDNISDGQEDIKESIEYISVEQSFLDEKVESIKDTLEAQNDKIDAVSTAQVAQSADMRQLSWIVRNQDTFTPEQLELLLDEWLKKNDNQVALITDTIQSMKLYSNPLIP